MDVTAPEPTGNSQPTTPPKVMDPVIPQKGETMLDPKNPSAVTVTVAGCGGCGINLARPFVGNKQLLHTLYFDTSMTNTRSGEKCNIITNGSGSGSNRAENARAIESSVPQIPDDELAIADVAIVKFSLAGGSGSVIGPLLIREYHRRGVRVIGVAVADTSSAVGATNTLNSLKTLTSIAKNNEIYLPLIILSNDQSRGRGGVDELEKALTTELVDILTRSVYEVDRNDRLNWVNPTKIVAAKPGLKLISFESGDQKLDPKMVLGTESTEMVDSLLILRNADAPEGGSSLPPSRLKKTGFYYEPHRQIVGRISSDVTSIDKIIDMVEKSSNQDKAQKHQTISRLDTEGEDDLVL